MLNLSGNIEVLEGFQEVPKGCVSRRFQKDVPYS